MPGLGIFDTDKFKMQELTVAVNEAPKTPSHLGDMGLFEEEGVTTTAIAVERDVDTLTLVPAGTRGTAGDTTGGGTRSILTFNTVHLPTTATIKADDVQNLRAFGKADELDTLYAYVVKRLHKMRQRVDATLEYQRIGAIKGKILDANGTTVLEDLYTRFSISQQSHVMALNAAGTDIRQKAVDAIRLMEDGLGDASYTGAVVLCGRGFFDALANHEKINAAYNRWADGEFLRSDVRAGFPFAGATWVEYKGSVGGVPFIASDEAYLVPVGVQDLFITRFAPADYEETVNTIGLPLYAKQWDPNNSGKSRVLEVQSNPISLCTRPKAVIKLTVQ